MRKWILPALVTLLVAGIAQSDIVDDVLRLRPSTLPAEGYTGELRVDTSTGQLRRWDTGTSQWVSVADVLADDPTGCSAGEFATDIGASGDFTCSQVSGSDLAAGAFDDLAPTTTKGDLIVFDGTNNTRLAVGSAGQVLKADPAAASGLAWGTGGGSGGSGINFESDPYFQLGSGDWTLHADPTDLDGGTTTGVTFDTDTTSTQIFSGDFKGVGVLSKDAADRDGIGVVKTYTIPAASQAQGQVYVSGWYSSVSGLSTGDVKIAAYDATNSTLLTLYGITDQEMGGVSAGGVKRFTARIPISSNTASLRLSFYWNDGTTDAKDFYFAGLKIGPDELIDVPVNAALDSYTPTLSDSTNVSVNTAKAWRLGEHIMVRGDLEWGGNGAGTTFTVSLPPGLTFGSAADETNEIHGGARWFDNSGTETRVMTVHYASSTTVRFFVHTVGSAVAGTSFAASDGLNYWFMAPIAEWANSSAVMSTTALMNQTAILSAQGASQTLNDAVTAYINFTTIDEDTANGWVPASGTYNAATGSWSTTQPGYVIQEDGCYFLATELNVVTAAGVDMDVAINVVGGDLLSQQVGKPINNASVSTSTINCLEKGDKIVVRARWRNGSGSTSMSSTTARNTFKVMRVPNFSVYGAYSDPIFARYSGTAGQALAAGTAEPLETATLESDSRGDFNTSTNTFVVPKPGVLKITANFVTQSISWTAQDAFVMEVRKGGVYHSNMAFTRIGYTASSIFSLHGNTEIPVSAGDEIQVWISIARAGSLSTSAGQNWVSYSMD